MNHRLYVSGGALALLVALAPAGAHADSAAMTACAAKLTPDAKIIFDKTLPQVTPSSNLRDLLTSNTRSLAMAGTVKFSDARQSATAAGHCLQQR
jgi:hypothetical protein